MVSFPCPSHLDPNTTLLLGLYLSPALTPWLLYVEATPVVLAVVVAVTVTGSDVHRGVVVAMDVLVRGACGISMSCWSVAIASLLPRHVSSLIGAMSSQDARFSVSALTRVPFRHGCLC